MNYPKSIVVRFAFAVAIAAFTVVTAIKLTAQGANGVSSARPRILASYGKLPISFDLNQGQTDKSVQFLAQGSGYSLFLRPGEAVLALHSAHRNGYNDTAGLPSAVRSVGDRRTSYSTSIVLVRLIGANTSAAVVGLDPLPGKSNYFIGSDPAKWHTKVPTYARVRYSGVYPGVDLIYYGNQEGRLEHDFIVAPGANPEAISMDFSGSADNLVKEPDGDLMLRTKSGHLSIERPIVYQMIHGRKKTVEAAYTLSGKRKVGFKLGDYDKRASLVIDPVIRYTGIFGGSNSDLSSGIAIDNVGNAYVTGATYSTDFPVVDPVQGTWSPASSSSTIAFVAKVNSSGTALLYSTYLGGPSIGGGGIVGGIVVDGAGRAYVSGGTQGGFPVTNAYQPTYGGGDSDAFVAALNPSGDSLLFSTYLGGPGDDFASAIALDASGNVYIAGDNGSGFPTLNSIQAKGNAFVAKFNSAGDLQYASLFAGLYTIPFGISVDASGSAYIAGNAYAGSLSATEHAFQPTCRYAIGSDFSCAFAAKLSPSGKVLAYSTYVGQGSYADGIAVDSSGNAYIGGDATSGFPVTQNGFQRTFGGGTEDGFVAKLNASGTGLLYATYLGGKGWDEITSLALDQYRQVYVAGYTCSSNFPLKSPVQTYVASSGNEICPQFVTTLSGSLSSIPYYSTYFGKYGTGAYMYIAVDKALNVYLEGWTNSTIKSTPGALSTGTPENPGGGGDIFVSKLVIMDDLSLALSASPNPVRHGSNLTYTIVVTSKGPDFATNLRVTDALPAGTTFVSDSSGGGTCSAPAVGHSGTLQCTLAQLNKGATYTVKLTVRVNAAAGSGIKNTASTVSNTQDFVKSNNTATVTTKVD